MSYNRCSYMTIHGKKSKNDISQEENIKDKKDQEAEISDINSSISVVAEQCDS